MLIEGSYGVRRVRGAQAAQLLARDGPQGTSIVSKTEEPLWRRRIAVAASVFAIGGFGAGAIGCGDDNDESGIEDAAEEVDEAAEDTGEAADEAAEDVDDELDDADDDGKEDDSGGGVEAGDDDE